jgi:hypothetical protein
MLGVETSFIIVDLTNNKRAVSVSRHLVHCCNINGVLRLLVEPHGKKQD